MSGKPFSFWLEWRMILAGSAIFTAGLITRGLLSSRKQPQIIPSPRTTLLPNISPEEQSELPYPPDALPGARDVTSAHGSLRVYEWGAPEGPKVLFIHGISTPCLTLGPVAHGLAEKGFRVMLFDLMGRGYSDTPADLPHDLRLFSTEILLALTSSPVSWTGSSTGGFSLVGYSLGGGIAAGFASYFPTLVNSLVLIAPSGLIRPYHFSRISRFIYSEGVIPEPILNRVVRKRLQTPLYPTKRPDTQPEKTDISASVGAEIKMESNSPVVLSKAHPNITIEAAVTHQVINHEGFVSAFMSSIRNGPISDQHDDWRRIGSRLTNQNRTSSQQGLKNGQVLIICGVRDAIINSEELEADATEVLEGNVTFKFIDAGHEAPVIKGEEIVRYITEFWD